VNWKREITKWSTKDIKVAVQYSGEPYAGDTSDVLIINYDIVKRFSEQLNATKWEMIVLDESHFLKNPKAQRTAATLKLMAGQRVALTGTPMPNRLMDAFPVLQWLDPEEWPNPFAFGKRYCGAAHNGFGWSFDGQSNIAELQQRLRSTCMIRRLKADVLKELPPLRRQIIELPPDDYRSMLSAEARQYDAHRARIEQLHVAAELAKTSDNPEDYKAAAKALGDAHQMAFTEMAAIRLEIGLKKVPAIVELVSEVVINDKVIIFAHHHEVVNELRAAFPGCAVITGEVPAHKRQDVVDRFQNDPSCRVFIGNSAAAEGITLTAATHVWFAEGQWTMAKLMQMEGRPHRLGQRRSVNVVYPVIEGSIDSKMISTCVKKMDLADKALDHKHDPVEYETPPVITSKPNEARPMTAKRQAIEEIAATLSESDITAVHEGLQRLAACDTDKASTINGIGFSKLDVRIGHELADCAVLSPKRAALGLLLCRKYQRQLGEGVWTRKGN